MDLELLPPGRPGEDLGVAHLLKHWLNPGEQWDDLAQDVPADARPRDLRAALPATLTPIWDNPTRPDGTVRSRWGQLETVYRQGYGAVVQHLAAAIDSPDQAPLAWVRGGAQRLPTWVDSHSGVVLRVRRVREVWQLYTAFRPSIRQYAEMPCPPQDAASVQLRKRLYGHRAMLLRAGWASDQDTP